MDNVSVVSVALISVGLAIIYWHFFSGTSLSGRKNKPSVYFVVLYCFAVLLLLWSTNLRTPSYYYESSENPLSIAIAFDISPSMLAIPDPAVDPDAKPRYERGLEVIKELFRNMEESQENYLISIVGFTTSAEVIMGWENNPLQIREVLDHIISPELFTLSGTSLEAAVKAQTDVFNRLPQHARQRSHKIAILVSDGEVTSTPSNLPHMSKLLKEPPFDLITLQTGHININEGVPRYDDFGEFRGFEEMDGRLFTVTDVDRMRQIANIVSRGLYVRAENPDSVNKILDFIKSKGITDNQSDRVVNVALGLFLIVILMCARLLL